MENMLSKRESQILDFVVRDYIATVQPISSKYVQESDKFDVSSATIRSALNRLDDLGLLVQPHTSAGRVPTDKGYRYFVDNLMRPGIFNSRFERIYEFDNNFFQEFVKEVADSLKIFTSIGVFGNRANIFSSGIDEVFEEPEFKNYEVSRQFAHLLDNVHEVAESYFRECKDTRPSVFIGKESPIKKSESFSSIVGKAEKDGNQLVIFSIGPKRLDYERAFSVINQICEDL